MDGKKEHLLLLLLFIMMIFLMFFSLYLGRYHVGFSSILKILLGRAMSNGDVSLNEVAIVLRIRLPRILSALLVGSALSVSGAALQGLFKNPLVSPYILGVSSGSGFGAALAILLSLSPFLVQVSALSFGILAVSLSIVIGRSDKGNRTLSLVLAGIIVGSTFTALISLVKYVADPMDKLPAIVFWLMGSLGSVTYHEISLILLPTAGGMLLIFLLRWKLNILAMGEEEAHALGMNPSFARGIVILSASMMTASAVSISGIIGWVGLVIPHISRILFGPDYRKMVPASIILGASYLLLMDDISRSLISIEIPLGILTAIVGAPIFAYLLKARRTVWA